MVDIVPWFLWVFFTASDFPTDLRCPPSDRPLTIIHHTLYDHPLTIIHHTHYSIIKLFSQNCWPLYIEDDLGTSSNISYMEDIVIFKCCNLNNTTCLLYRWVKHFISNSILVKIFYFCCSFYNLDGTDFDSINKFLSSLVEKALYELECSYCIEVDDVSIYPYVIYIYAPGSVWTGVFRLYWGGWCEYIPLYPLLA